MAKNNQHKITEPITYVWLDGSIKNQGATQTTAAKVHKLVKGRLQTFADPSECVEYITCGAAAQKLYLIVSNRLGPDVVKFVYDLSYIEAIYVYCRDQQTAKSWSQSYSKVRNIFTKEKLLLSQICQDVRDDDDHDHVLPISTFHLQEKGNSLQKLSPESAKFMWFQVAMNVLLLMAKHLDSKQEMINESRKQYHDDEFEKQRIDTFANEYQPERAFWWYTSNSFVYRLLNRALRTQDIDIIFKFRFFINDLHHQIQQLYRKYLTTHTGSRFTVYRGQFMSMDEIEFLRKNIDGIIAMNTFLSTSKQRDVAEMFFDLYGQSAESRSLESVLFTIDVSDLNQDTTAFAFIEELACNPEEREVIFTINAIFKVESVKQEGHIWNVHLQLSKQQNAQQKNFSKYMIDAVGSNPSLIFFGWFLYRMGEFERAERYAQSIINQHFSDEQDKADAYNLLGLIYNDHRKYEKAVNCYENAIKIYDSSVRSGSSQTIAIHYNLTLAYLAAGDYRLAEDHRRIVDKLLADSQVANEPLLLSMSEKLRGRLSAVQGNHAKALENLKVALQEKRKIMPPNHPSIAAAWHEIGIIHARMGDDTKAVECFEKAVDIGEKSLSADHFDLAEYHADIGRVRYKRKEYRPALEQLHRALKIITDATRQENDTITELLKCIKDINDIIHVDPLPLEGIKR